MRYITFISVLAIATSCFGQTALKASLTGNTDQVLMAIEQDIIHALIKGDSSANERYLADTATFTDPDGKVFDKGRLIADIKSGVLKLESSKLDDIKVQVYKDTAVVTYGTIDKGTYKGKDISGRYRWTDGFMKRNGRWQIVAGHGTRVGQ